MPSEKSAFVYWDSCVFIDRIQRTPAKTALCQK